MKADIDRITKLLTDTVTLLCKNGLTYDRELKIQGLLAITLDAADVFVVQINESFESPTASQSSEKSLSNAEKPPADKQTSRKRITPTTMRPSEEVVDLTRLAETPFAEPSLGHSRNINPPRFSVQPPANNSSTMIRPHALPSTNSVQSSRGMGFPVGSCWPMGGGQFLDVSGLSRFPNTMPPQNYGYGVRDETFASPNSLQAPLDYWANTRQSNPTGFCCPPSGNKPSRDLSVPAQRWPHNSNFALPYSQLRVMGPRHTAQRAIERLQYATDAVSSFGGTATDGNFRVLTHGPRNRQPAQTTVTAAALFPTERHAPQAESPNRCAARPRDTSLSQFIVSCPAVDPCKTSNPLQSTVSVGDSSSFAGATASSFVSVTSCSGRQTAPTGGTVLASVVKPCLSPVPGSSNNSALDLSEGIHLSTRSTGSTSASLPCTAPADQISSSFQSSCGSAKCISESDKQVNHVSESLNHGSRSVDQVSSHVSESVNCVSESANCVARSGSHGSTSPNNNPETIPAYSIVTIVPDDVDDVDNCELHHPNEDVKLHLTSSGNGCSALETVRATQKITEASEQVATQVGTHNLTAETTQGRTLENTSQLASEVMTELRISSKVQGPENQTISSDSCPETTGADSEAGSTQVSEQVTQQLERRIPSQNDVTEDLPVLTKVVPSETSKRKLAADEVVMTTGGAVCSSGDLIQMPKLLKSTNWCCPAEDEEQEREQTSVADPCTSLDSTNVVDTVDSQTGDSIDRVDCAVECVERTLGCPTGRSQSIGVIPGHSTGEIHNPFGAGGYELKTGASDGPSEAEDLSCAPSDHSSGALKQPAMSDNASDHPSVSAYLSSTESVHPPELMDSSMIESDVPSEALLCPSECSDPPLMESVNPSDFPPSTAAVFSCRSKDCMMTYNIASDLAFHYVYQHPELITQDLVCGNRKSRKCLITGNAYAKSLRASTASKREYSEQTRGLRDPSLVRPCGVTGKFVNHRPKDFPCSKAGCRKKYSSEKRLANHLRICHRRLPTKLGQVNSSNLRSNSEMDSSVAADNLEVNSSNRLDDSNFPCSKAGCRKTYSSEKRLSNHLRICHRKHPTNLEQVNSSNLWSDSEMNSSVATDNWEVNSSNRLDHSNFPCPKAGCRKKYSSDKSLSNHLRICHHQHPTNLGQVNSSNLRSDSEMESSVAADNCKVNSSESLDDRYFPCPKVGCRKKYSSGKRLSNHLQICHRERAASVRQMNSSILQSDNEMDSSITTDNCGMNSSDRMDNSKMNCGRDSQLEKTMEQGGSENQSS